MTMFHIFYILFTIGLAGCEIFTALVELEPLLQTESVIIEALENYIQSEEARLDKIRRLREEFNKIKVAANENAQNFLANPVNAFLLVKRLTTDLKTAESLFKENVNRGILENVTASQLRLPDDEDLNGAATALLRLQDTYKLDTASLADGHIEGVHESSPKLTAGDCFELGRLAYNNNDHYHTVLWMREALDRLNEGDDFTANQVDVLEYLAFSTYMQGNVLHAIQLTAKLIELAPDHPRAKGNLNYYNEYVKKSWDLKRGDEGEVPLENKVNFEDKNEPPTEIPEREIYEKLCRGEKVLDIVKEHELKCHLVTPKHPYYLLGPVKEEEFSLKPRIVLYHDILSDNEIETIKILAQPRLKRATVQNYKSGELEIANYRISKSAWLRNEEHPVVARLSRRIEAITGLNLATAEELQVVNYGIGGHYEPHFDFARREEKNAFKNLGTGNRIATWLNYMSDVTAGGATVFPHIGVTLWPKKGAAAFWHNLHRNGEGDMLTRHAACPVLAGSKWVSNKWLHERGQEFRRPCGLRITD